VWQSAGRADSRVGLGAIRRGVLRGKRVEKSGWKVDAKRVGRRRVILWFLVLVLVLVLGLRSAGWILMLNQ